MKTFHIICLLLIFTMLDCTKNDNPTSTITHQRVDGIIPMKVGYRWIYSWSSYDSSGYRFPGEFYDTVTILRDTLISNELWFIFNNGIIRTNRNDGVWFLSGGEPRLGMPAKLNDSSCAAPKPFPCEYYMKLVAVNKNITVNGIQYSSNVYDWMFTEFDNDLGYRIYTVPNLGNVRIESYVKTIYGFYFLGYTQDLYASYVN